jgi:uncharacterized membrane protein YczE
MMARGARLVVGCLLLGAGVALMVRADLGLSPWDVLHQGLSEHTGLQMGTAGIVVGIVVLGAWIPLRQRPGVGTLTNVILVGITIDVALAITDNPANTPTRWACLLGGVTVFAAGTGLYVGAGLGPGPRDGLMTALTRRHGKPVGLIRAVIELTVLVAGWLLGGSVGIGTIILAVAVGPLVQLFLGRFTLEAFETAKTAKTPTLTPPSE